MKDQTKAILFTPEYPSQPWYLDLQTLATATVTISSKKSNLRLTQRGKEAHSLSEHS